MRMWRTGVQVDSLSVEIADQPLLSYVGGDVSFQRASIIINCLDDRGLVSNTGAHFLLDVSSGLIKNCLRTEASKFLLVGPIVGQLNEFSGLSNYEYGGFREHAVQVLQIIGVVDLQSGEFHLNLSGRLGAKKQSQDHWQNPRPLASFNVDMILSLSKAGQIFSGEEVQMQASIDERLATSFDR
jgi:hypothetical protein